MTRLYILVEGQAEEQLVRAVLKPHLASLGVATVPTIVETNRERHG